MINEIYVHILYPLTLIVGGGATWEMFRYSRGEDSIKRAAIDWLIMATAITIAAGIMKMP